MPHAPSLAEPDARFLPQALLAALDDVDDARSRRASGWMSMLSLASPESVAAVIPAVAERLFDAALSVERRCEMASALATIPASWTGALVERLSSHLDDDRAVAAHALAAPRHLEAVPALVRAMSDHESSLRTRAAAVAALAAIGDGSAVAEVAALLDDDSAIVRKAAVVALRALAPSRSAAAFLAACGDEDVDVRCAALTALLVVGGPAACSGARRALTDDSGAVRALAVVTLARHGVPKDAARIDGLAADDDARVRRAVREAKNIVAA